MSEQDGTNECSGKRTTPIGWAEQGRASARRRWHEARQACRDLRLFGDAVQMVMERNLERVWETADEALVMAFEAYAESERERERQADAIGHLARELAATRETLAVAVERTEERHKKARRPLPPWVKGARAVLARTPWQQLGNDEREPF